MSQISLGYMLLRIDGAQKRTRTSTPLRAPAPEAGASTNSAIWARGRRRALGERGAPCQLPARWGKGIANDTRRTRSEEHTSELQSLMRISYAVFCLKKKNKSNTNDTTQHISID